MAHALIIGAGVAGAAAAGVLAEKGWQITVLDKGPRPGGRCATRRLAADPDSPWFDYGAQYLTADDEEFRALVERDVESHRLERWHPRIATAEQQDGHWQLTPSPDTRARFIGPRGLNDWVRRLFTIHGAVVRCRQRVVKLRPRGYGWRATVDTDDAETVADAVVVALPATQAAALLGPFGDGFDALAQPEGALAPCLSAVVEAPALRDCDALFVKNGGLAWCADNTHKAGKNEDRRLWTLHAGPDFSRSYLESEPDQAAARMIEEFAAIASLSTHRIEKVRTHRWRYARPGPNPHPACRFAIDRDHALALAGDWLAGGRIEGAWLSGRAAAHALAAA